METTDIVLTTWRREDICRLCIKTLKKNTKTPFRLIVIDNGSKREFQWWLTDQADIYVKLDKNYGLEAAKNIGMNFVESDLFISTDNDILVPRPRNKLWEAEDWLGELIRLMRVYPEYGAIALRPQVLVGTGDIFGDGPPEVLEFSHVPGYMRIMRTALVKKLGAWCDRRPLRGHEEYWISERIRKEGKKVGWASYVRCYHVFGDENWGYDKNMKPEDHGHSPTNLPKDDWDLIRKEFL